MNPALLKHAITERLWQVVDEHAEIVSATLTGSYTLSIDGVTSPAPAIATPAPAYTATREGNLIVGGAREFYSIAAPPNTTTLNLSLTPLQSADTFLELYDASGALIASSNSGWPDWPGRAMPSTIT